MIKYKIVNNESNEWESILKLFRDSSIYQTDAFARKSLGGENIEKFIVYNDSEVIGAALVRLKVLPILNKGLAYIRWGPLINLNEEILEEILALLKNEYVFKRNLLLRILSYHYPENQNITNKYEAQNFVSTSNSYKSILIDLTNDIEKLKSNLRKKWRYSLKQAEKKELVIDVGSSEEHFDTFYGIYKEMHSRKKFDELVDVQNFKRINNQLSDDMKMKIFLCSYNNVPVSGILVSTIGEKGIYLFGGSTEVGLKTGASYLLQWEAIKWLKSKGKTYYDLGGIDSKRNPGVYTFKSGMGGKEITYPGTFQMCNSLTSRFIVKLGEIIT